MMIPPISAVRERRVISPCQRRFPHVVETHVEPDGEARGEENGDYDDDRGKAEKRAREDHDKQRDHGRNQVADHLEEERQMFTPFAPGEAGEPLDCGEARIAPEERGSGLDPADGGHRSVSMGPSGAPVMNWVR
jgi:hypothetical protein